MMFITSPIKALTFACLLMMACGPASAEPIDQLAPLKPFVGKTWQADLDPTDGEAIDIARWEWAMNGKAIRILHSVNNGAYGGETLIHFDAEANQIVYRYVTTAAFYTEGTITVTEDGFTAEATVIGLPGTHRTEATHRLVNGNMEVSTRIIKDSDAGSISKAIYVNTPDAVVVFRN